MIFSTRLKEWIKFFILFILFTLLFYQIISFISTYFDATQPNKKIQEDAIRVFAKKELEDVQQRLELFYLLGE
ncbi:DUF4227 family protein [Thermoflavimicrobium daqui]|uniref:DUF4227 family protein n=1 Tax=Thermoflavimicrobium daqui TaxID=2137476 RepID=A0A364K8A1_9BACL|nr:DUF4227 family protein [Thermoflavimicrobium daqui]RAL26523.1 hypothetical protein DL897_00240 [Thermoflavimicrobium daqui]